MKRFITTLIVVASLAATATASADVKTYGGRIEGGGRIGVDAQFTGGTPFEIKEMRFKRFPADCQVSGPSTVRGGFDFQNVFVVNKQFSVDTNDGAGNHVFFKGTFKNHARKIVGRVQLKLHFDNPSEDCTTRKRDYTAIRGARAPKVAGAKVLGLTL